MVKACSFVLLLDLTKYIRPLVTILDGCCIDEMPLLGRRQGGRLGWFGAENDETPAEDGGYKSPKASCGTGCKKIRNKFTRQPGRFCRLLRGARRGVLPGALPGGFPVLRGAEEAPRAGRADSGSEVVPGIAAAEPRP